MLYEYEVIGEGVDPDGITRVIQAPNILATGRAAAIDKLTAIYIAKGWAGIKLKSPLKVGKQQRNWLPDNHVSNNVI